MIKNDDEDVVKILENEIIAETLRIEEESSGENEENEEEEKKNCLRPRKQRKNLLHRLQNGSFTGPLALLWQCSRDGRKVRVWIRDRRKVHAICCGQVAAFDSHFNLALVDVDEIAVVERKQEDEESGKKARKRRNRQKRRQKAAMERDLANGTTSNRPVQNIDTSYKKHVDEHRFKITKHRHFPQLFIRGDEVLIISPISPDL